MHHKLNGPKWTASHTNIICRLPPAFPLCWSPVLEKVEKLSFPAAGAFCAPLTRYEALRVGSGCMRVRVLSAELSRPLDEAGGVNELFYWCFKWDWPQLLCFARGWGGFPCELQHFKENNILGE